MTTLEPWPDDPGKMTEEQFAKMRALMEEFLKDVPPVTYEDYKYIMGVCKLP